MKILRFFLKFIFGILIASFVLVVPVGGLIYYALIKKELKIPENVLRWAAEKVLKPFDCELTFKSMQLTLTQANGFYQRHLLLRIEDLKFSKVGLLSVHIPDLALELEMDIHPKHYGIAEVGPINIHGAKLLVKLPAPDLKKPDSGFTLDRVWLERLQRTRFKPIQIGIKGLIIERPGESKVMAQIDLNLQKPQATQWTLALLMAKIKGLPIKHGNIDVSFNLSEGPNLTPLYLSVKGQAELVKFGKAVLSGNMRLDNPEKGQFKLDVVSNIGSQRQLLKAAGQMDKERFNIQLSGQASYPIGQLQKVEVDDCQLNGIFRQKGKAFLQSNLSCLVALTRASAAEAKPFEDMLPKRVQFSLNAPITIANWDDNPSFEALMAIAIKPLQGQLYTLRSSTQVRVSGRVFGGVEGLNTEIDANTQISLDKFQPMVKRLAQTNFSIPAPFNTLDGRIYCVIQGRIKQLGAFIHLPLSCGTELESETQSLFVQATGVIEKQIDQKAQIRMLISLDRVTFELPKLALNGSVPQIFPDKRISKVGDRTAPTDDSSLPVVLDIKISTPANRPVALITQISKVPVPISIDLNIKGEKLRPIGSIAILNYNVSFLKKKAYVDHLRLILTDADEQPGLAGLVVFDDPDVKISLKLSGSLDRPFYVLESQPPQASGELLSMILFGGNSDALDESYLRSVEETRAAMVDGAIGLLSMYYLASTPIESVGYNPYTGLFRARVKVAAGLSLMVGSDLEGARQSVTLRKRLTENWSFETGAETNEQTNISHGVAMFKWGRRY